MKADNSTIAAYDKNVHTYDNEVIDFWRNFPRTTLIKFKSLLRGNDVLNLGSGSGRDAILLRDIGLNVVCVDGSKEMIKKTNELGFASHHLRFSEIKTITQKFDGIWAYTSLLHIPKNEMHSVLSITRKMLKQNGALLIGMIIGEQDGDIKRADWGETERYFRYYQETELRELVESCGYQFIFQEKYQPKSKVYLSQCFIK